VLPFRVQFQPGVSAYRQVVFAAQKACVRGALRPGDRFPSVRELSQELKINPNTAHKVIAELARDGLLEMRPGVGAFVAAAPPSSARERAALLEGEIERLTVEAKRLGLDLDEVLAAVERHWQKLSPEPETAGAKRRPQ
jgi:GntR family transcriptional regulator